MYNDTKERIGVIYLVKNLYNIEKDLNPKYYIGSKKDIESWENTEYYGSSKYIKRDIEKLGIENFSREILCVITYIDDYDLVLNKEREILIEQNAINSREFYNLKLPGADRHFSVEVFERKRRKEFTKNEIEFYKTMSEKIKKFYADEKNKDIIEKSRKKASITLKNRKSAGIFTEKEIDANNRASERKSSGNFTAKETEHYENFRKRLANKDFTEAELEGKKITAKKLKDRKGSGNFTEKELAAIEILSERMKNKDFTEAELEGHKKISITMKNRFITEGRTAAEKIKSEEESARKLAGNFTEKELDGLKRRTEKLRGRKMMNDGVNNKMILPSLVDDLINSGWKFGWIK